MKHYNHVYVIGKNVDSVKFNPSGSCEAGGLYFCQLWNFKKFSSYGSTMAEVTIDDDAQVYIDDEDKFKADKITIGEPTLTKRHKLFADHDACLTSVENNFKFIRYVVDITDDIADAAIYGNPLAIKLIPDLKEYQLIKALDRKPELARDIHQTVNIRKYLLEKDPDNIEYIISPTEDEIMSVVTKDGMLIRHVTSYLNNKIINAAIEQNPLALKYVNHQTSDLCIAALKKDLSVLEYIKEEPTPEMINIIYERSGSIFWTFCNMMANKSYHDGSLLIGFILIIICFMGIEKAFESKFLDVISFILLFSLYIWYTISPHLKHSKHLKNLKDK